MIVHVYPLWMLEKEASADDGIGDEVKKKSAKNNLAYLRFQRKQDKLLVTVLESGPSAINQISLIFRTHSYTTIQLVSIAISIGSLTFGSVKNLFVIRKKSEADMSQHKLSYVLYFFTMLVCNIFRLFSWALGAISQIFLFLDKFIWFFSSRLFESVRHYHGSGACRLHLRDYENV